MVDKTLGYGIERHKYIGVSVSEYAEAVMNRPTLFCSDEMVWQITLERNAKARREGNRVTEIERIIYTHRKPSKSS